MSAKNDQRSASAKSQQANQAGLERTKTSLQSGHSKQSIRDLQTKVIVAKLLKQYSAEKVFDKRECLKFLNEVIKQMGDNGTNTSLLKFDSWFTALDRQKTGTL